MKKLKMHDYSFVEPKKIISRSGQKFKMFCTSLVRGYKLETAHFDVINVTGKNAFKVIDCIESEAIQLQWTDRDEIKVVAGHHKLG